MRLPWCGTAALLLASLRWSPASAQTPLQQQVEAATAGQLAVNAPSAGIVVTGHADPLRRSDRRLSILQDSLPLDTGTGTAEPDELQHVATRLGFPASPDTAEGEPLRMMQRTQAPPAGPDPDAGGAAWPANR